MNSLEVFNEFNEKLITSLQMNDVIFVAKLNSKGLFCGNLKHEVREKASTSTAEAADHFLTHTIEKDLAIGKDDSFIKLLSAMTEFDSDSLKSLAAEIKIKLGMQEVPTKTKHSKSVHTTGEFLLT